jgi:hypothetical protein
MWAAAIVPEQTRRTLAADPRFADAASIMTLAAGVDLGRGLDAVMIADLGTAAQAASLATAATATLRDAKRNPQVLMLGLGPYLDGVSARANDHTFEVHAALGEPAFDDLLGRLRGLLALARTAPIPGFTR